jgi:HupE / UreJ protein
MRFLLRLPWGLLALTPALAFAHTATLSVLTVRERAPGQFITRWEQTQVITDKSAAYDLLRPVFPEHCRFAPPVLDCGARGLAGTVGFDGLGELGTSGMMKIEWRSGRSQLLSLTGAAPHVRVAGDVIATTSSRALASLAGVGVLHIWRGWDHLLFVLGLLWFAGSWRALLKTITAFTLAHSVTLGAATLGILTLPSAPVEAVIALSIAFLAVEAVRESRSGQASFTRQYPWLVAFGFGLLHGFGFAGALHELQLGRDDLPLTLLGFNVGVELGQLLFVAVLLALRPAWGRLKERLGDRATAFGPYAVGVVAMSWFFERVSELLPPT